MKTSSNMPYCSFQSKSLWDRTRRCTTNNAPFKWMTKFLWGRLAFCIVLRGLLPTWQPLSWSAIIPTIKDTAKHHLQSKIDIIIGICRFRESKGFSLSLKKKKKTCSGVTISHSCHLHIPNHQYTLESIQNVKWFNLSPIIKEIRDKRRDANICF